ncbi:MAG TPA: hypothetical protein DCS93_09885 [Microscillaceae bacterium]|nr:hypothetical protein [Microscillaceae bacterium]
MKTSAIRMLLWWSILLVPSLTQAQWTALNSGTNQRLESVFFVDNNIGYVGGAGVLAPTLLKTIDGGATWTSLPNNIAANEVVGLYFTSANVGWALVDNGLYQTTDGGTTWNKHLDLPLHNQGGITFKNSLVGMIYQVANDAPYYTLDGGQNWQKATLPSNLRFHQIHYMGGSSQVVYGVSNGGDLYKSSDDGATWAKIGLVASKPIEDIYFQDELTGYALGIDFILKTTNGGVSWVVMNDGIGGHKLLDAQTVHHSGGLYKTLDDWTTYRQEQIEGTVNDVHFPSANTGYAVNASGKIFKRDPATSSTYLGLSTFKITSFAQASQQTITINSSNGWTITGVPSWLRLSANSGGSGTTNVVIDVEANNNAYDRHLNISITNGDLTHTIFIFQAKRNAGSNWTEQSSGAKRPLRSVFFVDDNIGYAGGDGILKPTLLKTTDGGATWTSLSHNLTTGEILQLDFTGASVGWAIVTDGLYQTTDGGVNWTKRMALSLLGRSGVIFKDANMGIMYKHNDPPYYTLDGGQNWQKATFPISNINFKHIRYVGVGSRVVYGISSNDLLYKSSDDGATWAKVGRIASKSIANIYFQDELTGYALSSQFVLKTTNGGVSWSVLNNNVGGRKLVDAQTIQYSGGVYKTSDNWATFSEERISNFNSSVEDVHFPSTNIGYAVANDGKIFKTSQPSSAYLGISTDDISTASLASQHTITIHSSDRWAITGVPSWVHLSVDQGESGTTTVVINLEANNNTFIRTIAMQVQSGDLTRQLAIFQAKYNVDSYWADQNSGTNQNLQSVFFVDDQIGYAAGDGILSSTLLKTTNGGATWTSLPTNINTGEVLNIYFTGASAGWVKTQTGLHQTTDGGVTWTKRLDFSHSNQGGVTFKNATIGIASGSHHTPYYTLDGGQNWQASTFPSSSFIRQIRYVGGSSGVVYGVNYNELYKSSNNGVNWTKAGTISSGSVEDIYFQDALIGYALGHRFILKTINGGVSWSVLNNGIGGRKFLDAQTIQHFEGLYKTSDDWSTYQNEPISSILDDVYFPSTNTGYAVGSGGSILNRLSKKQQLINFSTLWNTNFGVASIDLSATATSNLAVNFRVVSGPATINGKKLTITGAGTITVEANQPGDDDYLAAPVTQQTIQIYKAGQTITFPTIANQALGATFDLVATASSGLEVSFQVTSGSATIVGNKLTVTGTTPITVEATQAGNENYVGAIPQYRTFSIIQVTQTIDFPVIADKTFDEKAFDLAATASSGLEVAFRVISGPVTLNSKTLTFTGLGTIVVEATQAGNNQYLAANTVRRTFTVSKGVQTIDFPAITDKTYGDADFDLEATASSGLAVDFQVISGPATLNGKTLSITGAGTVVIEANQAGDAHYLAANAVRQTFTVNKASQTLSFVPIQDKVLGDAPFEVQATASTGLAVTLNVVSGPATFNGNLLTLNGIGMVTLKATQAGNDNYLMAEVTQSFLVKSPTAKLILTQTDGSEINGGGTIDFGQTPLGVAVSQVFNIQNLGNENLTLSNLKLPTGFSLLGSFPSLVTSGSTASFQVQLDASDEGNATGPLSFTTNDPTQNIFEITLSGAIINNPDINLIGNGQSIANGSTNAQAENHTHFGATEVNGSPIVRTFFIENTGDGILKLTGNPVVQIVGSDAASFSLTTQPASTLSKGSQTTFQITFTPTSTGVKQAQVVIANNDADEGSYTFTIAGEVATPTALPKQLLVGTVKTFPNPTTDRLFLKINQVVAKMALIQFINNQGKIMKQQTIATSNNQTLVIAVSDLPSGIYTLVIQVGEQQIARKIIKH